MPRYAMVIKVDMCTGCQTCSVACKMENLTMPGCSRTIITDQVSGVWDVRMCNQCDNPPCVPVCPVQATWKEDSGITVVDQEKCIGCGQCVAVCPYQARRINPKKGYFKEDLAFEKTAKKAKEKHRMHIGGKVDKCDFCTHRLTKGLMPMCVEACTTLARVFGDIEDPKSEVTQLVAKGAKPLRPELGTKPMIFYI